MSSARQVANFDPALLAADEVSGDKVHGGTISGSPVLVTPNIGTPNAGVVTNLSGVLPVGVTGGTGLQGSCDPSADGWIFYHANPSTTYSTATVNFNVEMHLGTGAGWSRSGGQVTIGRAGWYIIWMHISHAADTATNCELNFTKNGTGNSNKIGHRIYWEDPGGDRYMGKTAVHITTFAAADTLEVWGDAALYGTTAPYYNSMNSFCGFRLGVGS